MEKALLMGHHARRLFRSWFMERPLNKDARFMADTLSYAQTTLTERRAVRWVMLPALLAPLIGYVAPLGMWAPIAVALILMGWDVIGCQSARQAVRQSCQGLWPKALLGLPLLGVIMAPMSLLPLFSAQRSLAVFCQLLALLALIAWGRSWSVRWRLQVVAGIGLSALACGVVFSVDLWMGSPLAVLLHGDSLPIILGNSLSRGASLHAFMVLPGAVALWRVWPSHQGRFAALVFMGLNIALLAYNTNDTAFMALLIACLILVVALCLPPLRWVFPLLAAGTILAMPVVIAPLKAASYCTFITKAPSLAHRMNIWHAVSILISERPLEGWGVDAARVAPGGKDIVQLRACGPDGQATGKIEIVGETIPLHPHNGALDLWFSLGAIGALYAAILVVGSLWAALRHQGRTRIQGAIIVALSCQLGLTVLVSYGLWQTWFLATLSIGIWALSLILNPHEYPQPQSASAEIT